MEAGTKRTRGGTKLGQTNNGVPKLTDGLLVAQLLRTVMIVVIHHAPNARLSGWTRVIAMGTGDNS